MVFNWLLKKTKNIAVAKRVRHHTAVLRSLRKVSRVIACSSDQQGLIENICKTLVEERGYVGCWILLCDESLHLYNCAGEGIGDRLAAIRDTFDNGVPKVIKRLSDEKHAVWLDAIRTEETGTFVISEEGKSHRTVAAPLFAADKLIGFMAGNIDFFVPDDNEELELFSELAVEVAYAVNSIDMMARKKMVETAYLEVKNSYKSLTNNLPDVIMRFDSQFRHLFVSETVTNVVNMKPSAFLHKTHRDLGYSENDCQFWESHLGEVLKSGKQFQTILEFANEKGRFVFDWRLVPEFNSKGEPNSVLSIGRDITEYQLVQRNYEDLFCKMLDGFALHEIILDECCRPVDYRFLSINPAFEQMTGLKSEDVTGKRVSEVIPDVEAKWIEVYGEVALTGEPAQFEQFSAPLQKHFEVIAFQSGKRQFACIFRDVTERRHLEEQLLQSQKMEAVGQLAGGVAHDFNNQLVGIMGYAEMLMKRLDDEKLKKYAESVFKAASHSANLICQLLAFSRKGKYLNFNVKPVDILHDVIGLLKRSIDRAIRIETDFPDNCPVVTGDPSQLQNAFLNLAVNARDAIAGNGVIRFRISLVDGCPDMAEPNQAEQYVRIDVEDSGTGIPEDILNHIYEPFFTTKDAGRGTGMGLASVYGTVKNHRGAITVDSSSEGTLFSVYLPVESESEAIEIHKPSVAVGGMKLNVDNHCVLVVDDEEIVCELLEEMLFDLGFSSICLNGAREAIEYFNDNYQKIDAVISDMVMPEMGGEDVFYAMKKICPDVRILISSGHEIDSTIQRLLENGAAGFLKKPYQQEQLAEVLIGALS